MNSQFRSLSYVDGLNRDPLIFLKQKDSSRHQKNVCDGKRRFGNKNLREYLYLFTVKELSFVRSSVCVEYRDKYTQTHIIVVNKHTQIVILGRGSLHQWHTNSFIQIKKIKCQFFNLVKPFTLKFETCKPKQILPKEPNNIFYSSIKHIFPVHFVRVY